MAGQRYHGSFLEQEELPLQRREANVCRAFLQLRRQQRTRMLAEAQLEADEASAQESSLVFALDRADFLAEQLQKRSLELAGYRSEFPEPFDADEWRIGFEASEESLTQRWQTQEELREKRSQARLALRRLNTLLELCKLAGTDETGAGRCEDLASSLKHSEAILLAALKKSDEAHAQQDGECRRHERSNSDVLLDSMLSLLLASQHPKPSEQPSALHPEPSCNHENSQDLSIHTQEEELRRLLADLSSRNETLRSELQEFEENGLGKSEADETLQQQMADSSKRQDATFSYEEADIAAMAAALRESLAEAYEELAFQQLQDEQTVATSAPAQQLRSGLSPGCRSESVGSHRGLQRTTSCDTFEHERFGMRLQGTLQPVVQQDYQQQSIAVLPRRPVSGSLRHQSLVRNHV
eukprot:TRINITY_DN92416_c0_g1_i1.p1 TRINITY_DN92416_c0_g1~~TRINITY_DN92416_c0_g1_i1.p1  ORF type:complete len:426 (+),score=100.92 TRINITY_DN92416_c0_g1_i1:46-1278(+)